MNALIIQVGFVQQFIEIYMNKCSRIPSDWSQLENKIRSNFGERSEQFFFDIFALFESSLANVISDYLFSFLQNDIHCKRGAGPLPPLNPPLTSLRIILF